MDTVKEEIKLAQKLLEELSRCIEEEDFGEIVEQSGIVKSLMKSVCLSAQAQVDAECSFDETDFLKICGEVDGIEGCVPLSSEEPEEEFCELDDEELQEEDE